MVGAVAGAIEGGLSSAMVLRGGVGRRRVDLFIWVFVYICFAPGERTDGCGFHEEPARLAPVTISAEGVSL